MKEEKDIKDDEENYCHLKNVINFFLNYALFKFILQYFIKPLYLLQRIQEGFKFNLMKNLINYIRQGLIRNNHFHLVQNQVKTFIQIILRNIPIMKYQNRQEFKGLN